ncbi:hypothetical protein [Ferruginibacter sp. SUN106]|uniref:hypothetical protein n=1 Tax=Ferruginibacter sp. SUN106 TaxID=2978348 RepID=UPI003D3644CF
MDHSDNQRNQMKIKSLLFFAACFVTVLCFGQTQVSTDTSVIVIPHWKKGDIHKVKFSSTTINKHDGKEAKYLSVFEASFSVIEKDTTGYIVEWVYTKCSLAPGDITTENQILAGLVNTKLVCKLSTTGRFKDLENADELMVATGKVVDDLINKSQQDPTMNIQYVGVKNMLVSKQALELVLLKQIKFYNFSFGYKYRLNFVQTNKLKMPSLFGGQPYDGVEKVELKKLDNPNAVCIIETSKTVDNQLLKTGLMEYLKKAAAQAGKQMDTNFNNENLEYTEATMQQIEFNKGLIQKADFTRVVNLGIQNRTIVIAIEAAD